jgi:hypothetical protein
MTEYVLPHWLDVATLLAAAIIGYSVGSFLGLGIALLVTTILLAWGLENADE